MKLKQFRVRGFRCIHDTDLVSVSDATTLIGKNESGKTAILGALVHLNRDYDINEQDICDELVDKLGPDDRIVEGRFELSDAERELMQSALPGISQLTDVLIFRLRDAKTAEYEFPGAKFPKKFACNEAAAPTFLAAIEQLSAIVPPLITAVTEAKEEPESCNSEVQKQPEKPRATTGDGVIKQWEAAVRSLVGAQPFEFKNTDSLFKKVIELATPYVKSAKSATTALEASKKAFKNLFIQDD